MRRLLKSQGAMNLWGVGGGRRRGYRQTSPVGRLGEEGKGFDLRSFILANVTVGEMAAISLFLWPEFTEYRGCVFLSFLFEQEGVDAWFKELQGEKSAVEGIVNHIHLWDILALNSGVAYEVLTKIAKKVGEMWKAALEKEFPARNFVVSLVDEADDYGSTISFHSE